MIRLADVNVVFALLVEAHACHRKAWRWWKRREDSSVALCLPVRLGVLRLLTNAIPMQGRPISPAEALAAWDCFDRDPRTMWLPVLETAHELHFRRFVEGRKPSPNLWTDAWIAALAESSAIGLTSFDSGFLPFRLRDFELLKV